MKKLITILIIQAKTILLATFILVLSCTPSITYYLTIDFTQWDATVRMALGLIFVVAYVFCYCYFTDSL